MTKKRSLYFLLFFAFFLVFARCGYRLRGTGSFLPEHIKRITIPMFKNRTTRFQLDVKLTQSVIEEIVARGKIEITGDMASADAVLIGEIITFEAVPIAFGVEATADRYKIVVVANILLRDLVSNKIIYSNPNLSYQDEYEVPEGVDFETVESEAIDKVAEKFARSLVITILEGF
jgi:phosphoglucomutase